MRKEALIIIIILLIAIAAVFPKIIGLVIHTPSRVSVDTGIIVVYNNFLGETTNFIYLNDSQLENINNMTLETSRGKIIFSETINLSQDVNDNIVNLDNNINLSYNYIYINT
ncbi:hypothetical protein FJZ19_06145, partial [Candidatus Pacearchaeota archaeon]|nr:hypothetical protein [Candidatus Pacearchaeota archaeon]